MESEESLWLAVLNQALIDLKAAENAAIKKPSLLRDKSFVSSVESIHRYFNSEQQHVGSFRFICMILEIDIDHARETIRRRNFLSFKEQDYVGKQVATIKRKRMSNRTTTQ